MQLEQERLVLRFWDKFDSIPEDFRLDIINEFVLLSTGGKKYFAPLRNPQNVLDIGTGTGIWTVDFAWDNPQAQVRGVDLRFVLAL